MNAIQTTLRAAAAGVIGMLAGAMLLIKVVFVPFWRGAPPREFRIWFGKHSGRIRSVMGPLGAAGLGLAAATTTAELVSDGSPRSAAVAAAGSAGVVAITLGVNEPANAKFEQEDFDDAETTELLQQWSRWHDIRVILGLVATAAALTTARTPR